MPLKNKQVLLESRPQGQVVESNFRIVETAVPELVEGEVLIKLNVLSLDPYMRSRMDQAKNYAQGVNIGDVMVGAAVGEVIKTRNGNFQLGDTVTSMNMGWQQYVVSTGEGLQKIDARQVPAAAYLSVLGLTGVTGWYGLNIIGEAKAGETVVISGAAGAVGTVVGQLAKIKGCRVVGIDGGVRKCDYLVNELGFDAAVDYQAGQLAADLETATPDGIDVFYDNVGGETLDIALARLNEGARIPLCGMIAGFGGEVLSFKNFRSLLVNRVRLQGMIVTDRPDLWPIAVDEIKQLIIDGKLTYRENLVDGLDNAPKAFISMLKGEHFGKQLVKIA